MVVRSVFSQEANWDLGVGVRKVYKGCPWDHDLGRRGREGNRTRQGEKLAMSNRASMEASVDPFKAFQGWGGGPGTGPAGKGSTLQLMDTALRWRLPSLGVPVLGF